MPENKLKQENTKKKKKEIDPAKMKVLPNNLAEHVQAMVGLSSDEIIKLLESLNLIDDKIEVSLQRPAAGKNMSKPVKGKNGNMKIAAAVDYEKKRAEQRLEKEQQVREMFDFYNSVLPREKLNDESYPKQITPDDIAQGIEAARKRLIELTQKHTAAKPVSPNEEAVLNAMLNIKRLEAVRIARYIAERQRQQVLGKTLEQIEKERKARIEQLNAEAEAAYQPDKEKNEEKKKAAEEKKQEFIKTLPVFDKDIHTLADEAGDLAAENIDAAAAVMRQWIGNTAAAPEDKQ